MPLAPTDKIWLHDRSSSIHRSVEGQPGLVCDPAAPVPDRAADGNGFIIRDEDYIGWTPPDARCWLCFAGTEHETPWAQGAPSEVRARAERVRAEFNRAVPGKLDEQTLHDLLAGGKYTHWMLGLSVDQLAGLLWLVGEYAIRTRPEPLPTTSSGARRRVGASNAMADFRRTPLTLERAKQYIRRCIGPAEDAPKLGPAPTEATFPPKLWVAAEIFEATAAQCRAAAEHAGVAEADAEALRKELSHAKALITQLQKSLSNVSNAAAERTGAAVEAMQRTQREILPTVVFRCPKPGCPIDFPHDHRGGA